MRIIYLTFTHVDHPLQRGQMAAVESHKGATLASGLTIRSFVFTPPWWGGCLCFYRGESEVDLLTTRPLSTLDVIDGPHFSASGPSDISQRRLHQQKGNTGDNSQHPLLCPAYPSLVASFTIQSEAT